MEPSSRRKFISKSAKAGLAAVIATQGLGTFLSSCAAPKTITGTSGIKTGFSQTPLPYAYNALEPWIDTETMDIHYNKHAAAYAKNLNDAAKDESVDTGKPLEDVLQKISKYSIKMRNNAGGHYNHELFWKLLSSNTTTAPKGALLSVIERDFGSLVSLQKAFNEAAKSRFGSGWAWLIYTEKKQLMICSTPNQDNTLMDIAENRGFPLFGLDVWEHAYYLKYRNRRAEYIDNFWKILNWEYVQQRFDVVR
ncbi:superoxide dismutase [Ferruginibacter lapsinanis]|uniref:superoxide dismutase n=1 Tax=Ferruginibacter lapsinanis TaxID=563172 RepID=UPI001E53F8D4|nr:superoxide dismutase [Ferruginibacter lapsinanis]UEG50161.1 superoxide dismutase [Ferruginibacter lapsinanis]